MYQYANTAVQLHNATKSFGTKSVLHNLNMHVEKGIIYGLLGSSGCGKTTLLNCIVGRRRLDHGSVWVLGGPPGSSESGVPGPRVGFMPQDVALAAEFTVKSAIYYFGRIFCMSDEDIKAKFKELTRLLDLPPADKFIVDCSGGQQRRISFAAALISSPELLVLDEPTVGLDPLLREGIWDYLLKLTQSHMASVIITTHYIEEARQANKVGLMRHGRLLADESPESLLNRFHTHSLEDVFLILSSRETGGGLSAAESSNSLVDTHSTVSTIALSELGHSQEILTPQTNMKNSKTYKTSNAYSLNYHRIKALGGKSWLQVTKNYSGIAFMISFPILQVLAFFVAVGDDVKDIKMAVCNYEDNFAGCINYTRNNSAIPSEDGDCQFKQLGCYFLQQLKDPMILPVFYNNIETARDAVQHGDATGAMYIPENFTESFHDRLIDGFYDNTTLDNGKIQVWLDMSNHQIGGVVKAKLLKKFIDFQKLLYSDCNIISRFAANPVNFDEHMYGTLDDTFKVFMAPAVILTALYFLGSFNTVALILTDRLEGIWDRSIVAGVSTLEIVFVHLVTQLIIVSVQTAITLTIAFPIYNTENVGSFLAVILITLLAGSCGVSYGFLVSIVSNGFLMANIIATGGLFPVMMLSGLMWPVEGMPIVLQWISFCMPVTLPVVSLRNVMKKGWSILDKAVFLGVCVQILWIGILVILSILAIKKRR